MLKRIFISTFVCVSMSSIVNGGELKTDMGMLAGSISALQIGFFTNDKQVTLDAAKTLRKHVKDFLGSEEKIKSLLPENLRYKSSIALNSAEMIDRNAAKIEKDLKDKNMRMIQRQMNTQRAFLDIQNQCFRCHNLVRDWK